LKKIKIYLSEKLKGDICNTDWKNSPILKTALIKDDEDIWNSPLCIDNKFYNVCMCCRNNFVVDELEYYKVDNDLEDLEEINSDNIKCPVCGYEESDCNEYSSDSDDEHICQGCGSELSWEREYSVDYIVKVNKIKEVKELI
jgi:hypothetical protein